jgi:hypothetical protein
MAASGAGVDIILFSYLIERSQPVTWNQTVKELLVNTYAS